MSSLYNEPYHPLKPPKSEEVRDAKLMTVKNLSGVECRIHRLSDRYFGVFEIEGTVFMTEGHDNREDAEESAEQVASLFPDNS